METAFTQETFTERANYAGFWIRLVAILIDGIITSIITITLSFFLGFSLFEEPDTLSPDYIYSNLFSFVFSWLYYAGLESSQYQGTLGKQMMGIYVTNEHRERIGFLRASGRYFAKILSAMVLLIGFIMAGFTSKKQALHDILARTFVLKRN